jgi:predicted transcriptional regulator
LLNNIGTTSDSNRLIEKSIKKQYHHYQLSESQSNILRVISQNPGIRYRELARQTGFVNGVLTYHLTILEQIGYTNKFRHNNITRYYPLNIPTHELNIISHLRVQSEKDMILFILEHDFCSFSEIVEYSKKAPSTISWHLKRLCQDGIVAVHSGEYNLYRIIDKKLVNQMLHKYKATTTDKIINNLVDISEEL